MPTESKGSQQKKNTEREGIDLPKLDQQTSKSPIPGDQEQAQQQQIQ